MSINSFLYRRLSRWITCEFKLTENSKLTLKNKYEIASLQDVFCHPFYWQVFHWMNISPKLVVDAGANCGHFTILSDLCFRTKFGSSTTHYILIEPNPFLLQVLRKNLSDSSLDDRVDIKQGLLGVQSGEATLWINPKNYLSASLQSTKGSTPHQLPYLNLLDLVGDRTIDLLKIDIEGAEFEFVQSNLKLFTQVNLIFMELHQASEDIYHQLFESLESVGLNLATPLLKSNGQQLAIFHRQSKLLT